VPISGLLKHVSRSGDEESEAEIYKKITDYKGIAYIIDPLLDKISQMELQVGPYLFNLAKDLAFKSNHRNAVKVGIAVLGVCGKSGVLRDIKIIGLHD
jgi:hypothetical protein